MSTHDDTPPPRSSRRERLTTWLQQDVWHVELGGTPTFKRWWTKLVRVVLITTRGFVRDQCTRHAMALTYITIFALPPFLAFVFSIAKGFNVYRTLKEGTIDTFLDANFGADDGGQVRQAIDQIFTYVEDTPLGSVAAIGLIVILFAVFKLLGAVEFTLNDIWGIQRPRPLVRKVTDYLAIVTVTPILLVSGAGLTAFLNRQVAELVRSQAVEQPADVDPAGKADGGVEPSEEPGARPSSGAEPEAGAEDEATGGEAPASGGSSAVDAPPAEVGSDAADDATSGAHGEARDASAGAEDGPGSREASAPRDDRGGDEAGAEDGAAAAGDGDRPASARRGDLGVDSAILSVVLRLVSTLTIVLGMAFVIFTLPNTSVRLVPALLGGLCAGILWQLLQFGSVYLQMWLAGKNAIYSSLAAIPMLMIWIYLSWTILLVGAEFACAVQTEAVVTSLARTGKVDQRLREVLAPRLAVRVTAAFLEARPAPSAAELASEVGLAPRAIGEVLERLVVAGLLARTNDEEDERYLPGRDPGTIRLSDVLEALRREEGGLVPDPGGHLDLAVDRARAGLEADAAASSSNRTLREFALDEAALEAADARRA